MSFRTIRKKTSKSIKLLALFSSAVLLSSCMKGAPIKAKFQSNDALKSDLSSLTTLELCGRYMKGVFIKMKRPSSSPSSIYTYKIIPAIKDILADRNLPEDYCEDKLAIDRYQIELDHDRSVQLERTKNASVRPDKLKKTNSTSSDDKDSALQQELQKLQRDEAKQERINREREWELRRLESEIESSCIRRGFTC